MTRDLLVPVLGTAVLLAACTAPPASEETAPPARAAERAAAAPAATLAPIAEIASPDVDEAPSNRDPFRATPPAVPDIVTTDGAAASAEIESLRLVAVVSGVAAPYAMLEDAATVGHVVRRGDFVGRPAVVTEDGLPRAITWRVERIRDHEIVLARDGEQRVLRLDG